MKLDKLLKTFKRWLNPFKYLIPATATGLLFFSYLTFYDFKPHDILLLYFLAVVTYICMFKGIDLIIFPNEDKLTRVIKSLNSITSIKEFQFKRLDKDNISVDVKAEVNLRLKNDLSQMSFNTYRHRISNKITN